MSAKWKNVTVRQLCKMNQSSYTSKDHWEYINYLDTGSITRNVIEGYEHIDLTKVKLPSRAKRKVAVGDIIYSTVRPNLCHYGMLGEIPANCLVSTGFAVIKANEAEVNPRFLYYYLTLPEIVESLHSIGEQGQATYPAINPSDIEDLEISIPERNVQNKIVAVLSDYDAAIANCRKQIALLEEAAMRLYREWFGDGKGAKDFLWNVCRYARGVSYTSKEIASPDGMPLITLKNIERFGGFREDRSKTFSGVCRDDSRVVANGVLMAVTDMTKERRLVGHVALVPDSYMEAAFSMDLIHLTGLRVPDLFLYAMLRYSGIAENLASHASGANVIHLKPSSLDSVKVAVPDNVMINNYLELFEPMVAWKNRLLKQVRFLTEARDRLLPKLMKGEIEV